MPERAASMRSSSVGPLEWGPIASASPPLLEAPIPPVLAASVIDPPRGPRARSVYFDHLTIDAGGRHELAVGMKELRGKVAVVTGAASGIGRGLAERFVSDGMNVVMADVEEKALNETADELSGGGA